MQREIFRNSRVFLLHIGINEETAILEDSHEAHTVRSGRGNHERIDRRHIQTDVRADVWIQVHHYKTVAPKKNAVRTDPFKSNILICVIALREINSERILLRRYAGPSVELTVEKTANT